MRRMCRKCKEQPALPDGVLCATCRTIPKPTEYCATTMPKQYYPQPKANWRESASTYGLLWPQVIKLREMQNGKCAMCGQKRFLVLDHDHKTGKARGYLCRGCNTKLAGLDDTDFMGRATDYLKNLPVNNL